MSRNSSELSQRLQKLSLRKPRGNDDDDSSAHKTKDGRPVSQLSYASSLRGSSGSQLDVVTIPVAGRASLQDVINVVISSLEDIQGQYPELQGFETTILQLDENLRNVSIVPWRKCVIILSMPSLDFFLTLIPSFLQHSCFYVADIASEQTNVGSI